MKKGLIGIAILALIMLFSGSAWAATFESVDVEATLEWTIFNETGLMPEASYDDPALVVVDLTLETGAWSASTEDGYIKYTAEMGTVGLYAATSYSIYDLENDIAETQGITLATEMTALSLDLAYTADEEYGVGGTYDLGLFSVGAKYNSTGAYGVELVYPMDPITLTGQYAIGSAYLAKVAYALTAGEITLQYKVTDAAEISAELADFPIAATTLLGATATSTDGSMTITGTSETTLVEGVTFTLDVASTEGTLTYSGKIGVSF